MAQTQSSASGLSTRRPVHGAVLRPVKAFHRWISTPRIPLAEEQLELFAMTNYTMSLGLVAHLAFIPLFYLLGAAPMALLNVVSVAVFAWTLWLSRRARFVPAFLIGSTEVLAHAFLATLWFGLLSFLHMFAILAVQLNLLLTPVAIRARIIIATVLSIAYLAIVVVGILYPPIVDLPQPTLAALAVASLLITFTVMCGMAIYHTWMVNVTRAARITAEQDLEIARDAAVEARIEAEEASRAKSRFLASMSHELRTPMNAIIGYSEMVAEDLPDPGQREDIDKVLDASRTLLTLIDDILDLSKIESGAVKLVRRRFSLRECLQTIGETVQPLATVNGNQLVLRMDDALPDMVSDETKVRQIVLNLLSNACKFTTSGTITLEAHRVDGPPPRVRITVADTGIGMSEAALARIFLEFEQAEETTAQRYGGAGLGLALVNAFCRLLGGDVDVRSESGRGSRFSVVLPVTAPLGADQDAVPFVSGRSLPLAKPMHDAP